MHPIKYKSHPKRLKVVEHTGKEPMSRTGDLPEFT